MKIAVDNLAKSRVMMAAFIVLLGLAAYSFALSAPFKTMDDQFSIVNNPDIQDFSNIGKVFRTGYFQDRAYYRPLVIVSYMIDCHFFGVDPLFFKLSNIIIHLITALVIFLIIARIFQDKNIGFFVALLFAIHPVHWKSVSHIPDRSILLASLFEISAFYFFCLSKTGKRRLMHYAASLVFFALALLSKEAVMAFPLIVLSYELILRGKEKKRWLSIAQSVLPFLAVLVFYFLIRRLFGITQADYWDSARELILAMITFLRAEITYLRILFAPLDLYFDRSMVIFTNFSDPQVLLTFLFFGLSALILFRFRKKVSPPALFFGLWFLIGLLPVSQILPICVQPGAISTTEHFLYAPCLGVFVLFVLIGRWLYREGLRRKVFSAGVFCFGVIGLYAFLFITLVQQNIYSANELAMLRQSVMRNPQNSRVQLCLGLVYARKWLFKEAEGHFREALNLFPGYVEARIALGKALCDQGRLLEGLNEYERVADAGRHAQLLENNMRLTRGLLIKQYQAAIARDEGNADLHYSLGVAYSKNKETENAMEQYLRAVELRPDFKNALFNLASSYESIGRIDEAVFYYEKITFPDDQPDLLTARVYFQLANIYKKRGDFQKAEEYFQKSRAVKPR
ncbi:MAG TPA: tetratricopeptide repeat protein [Candidatus Omnitrophota bacterium]|nr:tetratricopeptide repeat protein [Candidatus Omnitrophota bacterium]HPD84404.1 tetratricopeptide repeat protein [Candidatus Omnitrophota bacterium]HRZ03262.1 tetratricopeptide repeat protein [Candidatus Omnitrophota bacterium]